MATIMVDKPPNKRNMDPSGEGSSGRDKKRVPRQQAVQRSHANRLEKIKETLYAANPEFQEAIDDETVENVRRSPDRYNPDYVNHILDSKQDIENHVPKHQMLTDLQKLLEEKDLTEVEPGKVLLVLIEPLSNKYVEAMNSENVGKYNTQIAATRRAFESQWE